MREPRDTPGPRPADPLGSALARAAFEAAREGLLVLDPDGVVLAMNAAFGAIYGLVPEERVGRPYTGFTRGLEVRRLDGAVGPETWVTPRALRGERVEPVLQTIRQASGHEFVARCGAVPLLDGDRLVATTITVEDVTEHARARQSVEGALSAAEVGTYRIDLVGRRIWGDANFARIHGLSEAEASGGSLSKVYELMHPDDRDRVTREVAEATRADGLHELEYRVSLPGGGVRWVLSRGKAEFDGSGAAVQRIGSLVDVTARKAAEDGLRRTQEWLGLAMRGGRMGWWRRDILSGEVAWSRELEAIFGLEAGSFDGNRQTFLDFVHPDDREGLKDAISQALEAGGDYAVEFRFRRADGSQGWMEGRGRGAYDDAGTPVASYGIGVDVTGRKAAEEALRRGGETFERLVADSPLGTYVVDADFRLAIASRGARRAFEGVVPLLGRDFGEVVRAVWPEPTASEILGVFRRCLETGEPHYDGATVDRRTDLDEVRAYDWKVERIATPDGRQGVVCHFHDVSEAQRRERELEARVEERTGELTRANRDLNEFSYSVAHDLRSPLRAIVSTSRMLLEDSGPRLLDEERGLLERQAASAVRLARIVDDLLQFARLAKADLRRREFDLSALARRVADEVRSRRGAREIQVREGMRALGDESLLGYALTNLVDNACKFSPGGGAVAIGEEGGAFFVRDRGVGFDMAHAPKLFTAFERLVGQEFEGTGVGLANVKRIVERHGGRVWAESEPGKGATFWFTLA